MQTSQHVNVFLASPGDVAAERALAEEVVDEVNRLSRGRGWYVDLYKWEDIPPAYGRPQARINSLVDQCDIFVGLLWERWGEPTGEYSSGFEEEFERALASCKAHNKPQIWLFFKNIDPAKLRDPGDQLKKVIAFRDSQRDSKELFFKQVRDAEQWKTEFRVSLLSHLFSLAVPTNAAAQQPAISAPGSEESITSAIGGSSPTVDDRSNSTQVVGLSAVLSHALRSGTFDFSANQENPLEEFDVARLFLLSSTLMSHRYTNEVLGTHELNLLYKYRERLEMSQTEHLQLLRAVVGDQSDVKPGWFWFRGMDRDALRNALLALASRDSSDEIRTGALRLLASAEIEIPQELWSELPLDHKSYPVQKSALDYFAALGDSNALKFLDALPSDGNSVFSSAIKTARFRILVRLDADAAVRETLERDEYASIEQLKGLSSHAMEVEETTLLKGVESQWADIRQWCVQGLTKRGALSRELAQKLTSDPSVTVRALSFEALAKAGVLPSIDAVRDALSTSDQHAGWLTTLSASMGGSAPDPDADSVIIAYFRTLPTDQLLGLVNWYSLEGHLAYRALAEDRFSVFGERVRSDLRDNFENVREKSIERQEQEFGPNIREWLQEKWADLEGFMRAQFIESGLRGLAKNAETPDAVLARPYLEHTYSWLREPAVEVICRVGSAEDVDTLLRIAAESYGEAGKQAAEGALRLSMKPAETAYRLICSKKHDLITIALRWLYTQASPDNDRLLEEFLHDESASRRLEALYYLYQDLGEAQLDRLLKEHLENTTYYYNVVTWLDRLLFAPAPLKKMYIGDLKSKQD